MERARRILLAVRIGDASSGPGRTAAWLAEGLGAHVTVVYVATELRTAPEVGLAMAIPVEDLRDRMSEEARQRTERWARDALGPIPHDVRVEDGPVAERIGVVATEVGADLVVAGTEARGAITGMILGDTTREILRRTPCPVVVVPPAADRD